MVFGPACCSRSKAETQRSLVAAREAELRSAAHQRVQQEEERERTRRSLEADRDQLRRQLQEKQSLLVRQGAETQVGPGWVF